MRLLLQEDSESVSLSRLSQSTPSYVGQSEALEYQMNRAKKKVEQLHDLHKAYLRRPAFDDSTEDQEKIDALTKEVTQVRHQPVDEIGRGWTPSSPVSYTHLTLPTTPYV